MRWFRFGLIAAALAVIACVSALVTMQFAIHGAEVAVPDLKGMTTAAAVQKGTLAGLNVRVDGKLYSTTLGAGRVLAQSPEAGVVVRRDWTMRVVESLGPERVRIPDVRGEEERPASIEMRRVGLELGTVARMPDGLVAPGTVLAQDPPPDAAGVEQPSVGLLVAEADAREPEGWVMPDWVGSPVEAAQAELSRKGLPAAVVEGGATTGVVVGQSPVAGARVTKTTAIVLQVGR